MPGNTQSKVVKVTCIDCGGDPRNHDVLREFSNRWDDDESGECGGATYQICRCKGCETVRFREESWNSFDIDPETGNPEKSSEIYPEVSPSGPRLKRVIYPNRWIAFTQKPS